MQVDKDPETIKAEQAMSAAMSRLVISQPWFASLAMRLDLVPTSKTPTADVDGRTMRYNPKYFNEQNNDIQCAILAHEVMHCALLHFARRGSRDPLLWNIAGDHVINLELESAGFVFPKGVFKDPRFAGKNTEEVYAILMQEGYKPPSKPDLMGAVIDFDPNNSEAQNGDGTPAFGSGNGDQESDQGKGSDPDGQELETDWIIAVAQADVMTSKAGLQAGGASRACKQSSKVKLDVSHILSRYFRIKEDTSWERPNRRFVGSGMYLPSRVASQAGSVWFAIDTSGSIDQGLLENFASIVQSIIDQAGFPEELGVMYIDTKVHKVERLSEGNIKFSAVGGGGTAFQPAFDYIAQHGIEPDVLFYLTDLDCYDRPKEPGYPVIWIAPTYANYKSHPFGECIKVETGRGY